MRTWLITLCLLTAVQATTARADGPEIKNTFGFDIMKPERSKCAKVSGALLKKLETSYKCEAATIGSASGKPIAASCKAKRGTSELLLFATLADCKEERETQLANAEGA